MSLITNIKFDPEWKDFFKNNVPKKTDFKTSSGKTAFSRDYIDLASFSFSNYSYYCLVGTAFDYLARWTIAQKCSNNKEASYTNLIAEKGLHFCQRISKEYSFDLEKKYEDSLKMCKNYAEGTTIAKEIIKVSIFFAKLENISRNPTPRIDIENVLTCETEVVIALEKLLSIFIERFISSQIITNESIIIYNPTFGGASYVCGGADADIYIDGTLYDFKCTKNFGYAWTDAAQILGYYFLDRIAKKNNDEDNCLFNYEIKRIALYKARFGEIEFIDLSKEKYDSLTEQFEIMLGKEEYDNYLREEKIHKEIENKRINDLYKKLDIIVKYNGKKINICDLYNKNPMWSQNKNENIETKFMNVMCIFGHLSVAGKICSEKFEIHMQSKNLNVGDIAQQMRVTPNTVKNWINGKSLPKLKNFCYLLSILNCTQDDILE